MNQNYGYPLRWLRPNDMVELSFECGGITGYFAGVYRGKIGIYTDPLEVESFEEFPLNTVRIRKL